MKGGVIVSGCIQMSSRPLECGNDSHATLPVADTHSCTVNGHRYTHTAVLPISISLNAPQENSTQRKTKNTVSLFPLLYMINNQIKNCI